MSKQTSIEWLEHKLNSVKPTDFCSIETIKEWLIEAKQMHKEEIKSAYLQGGTDVHCKKYKGMHEYHQETYGTDTN